MGLHRFRGLVSGFLGSGSNRNYRFEGLGGSGILVNPRPMQRTVQGEKPVPSSECMSWCCRPQINLRLKLMWEFPKIRGTLLCGPNNEDPTI